MNIFSQSELLALVEQAIVSNRWKREPEGLYAPIEYVLSLGGKRVRPSLVLMACNLFTDDLTEALKAGLAIEVFHNFTLLHDDIMDNADTRRGYATVHKRWNNNTAILSGDAMLIEAYKLLATVKSERFSEILKVFTTTADEVCKGQQYDMEFEKRNDVGLDEYMEMIRLKTAVLLACSLKIGALIGGASEADANTLYNCGINMGLSFQLRDDYLDAFGDPKVFGKNIGGDILCGKKCYLLLSALELAKGETKDQLNSLLSLSSETQKDEKINGVIDIYRKLDVDKRCEAQVSAYLLKAMTNLDRLSVPAERLEPLKTLIKAMANRKK
ncbi:MAG: polyprenyl synthetase family protein [Paludibacteraceae bacterium]|nr:polyprenyl synthetase family protein [Paludibacteraceae bacterium]MBQ6766045.1 polyprenyl synthetase family protein [Paludibacteraceae bacterium]